ncbi:MAG: ureidoglycolate lyase [Alphaproteobacteria bacterium]|nr:ureidoglycolate lyase [Alphaproteobacteria bacterium]
MADDTMHTRRLPAQPATPEALADYGWVIAAHPSIPSRPLNFYPGTMRMPAPFVSDEQTEISLVRLARRPLEVVYLERHFRHTQAFLPLGGKPFVLVLAPPSFDDMPPPEALRAFRFGGDTGFCLKLGCWHEFPFVLEDDSDMVVLLRRETYTDLQRVVNDEAAGADLDKRNFRRRTGTSVTIDV